MAAMTSHATEELREFLLLFFKLTDHYLFIESSSPAQPGYKARIISKTFPPTSGRCLSFWYHMRGSSIGELNVYSQTKGGGLRKLWNRTGEQNNTWQRAQVSLFVDTDYEVRNL
jgi:hypothetical protein